MKSLISFLLLTGALFTSAEDALKGQLEAEEVPLHWPNQSVTELSQLAAGEVKAGTLLLKIDSRSIELDRKEAVLELDQAKRQLQEENDRLRRLPQPDKITNDKAIQSAQKAQDYWLKVEAPAFLANAEIELERFVAKLQENREGLQQLEAMYDKSNIDKTTRELVVNRARRDISAMERQLPGEQAKRDKKINEEIPATSASRAAAVKNAQSQIGALKDRAQQDIDKAKVVLAAADIKLARAALKLQQIDQAIQATSLIAPCEGYLLLKAGPHLIRTDRATLSLPLPMERLGDFPPGKEVELRNPQNQQVIRAQVLHRSFAVRRVGEIFVADVSFVVPLSTGLRPGMELSLPLSQGK